MTFWFFPLKIIVIYSFPTPSGSTAWQPLHCFAPPVPGKFVHERSHSDTPTPLPSVDLSAESRWVEWRGKRKWFVLTKLFFQLRNIVEQHADTKKSRVDIVERQWAQRGSELLRGKRLPLDVLDPAQSTDNGCSSTASKALSSAAGNWKSLQPDDSAKAS